MKLSEIEEQIRSLKLKHGDVDIDDIDTMFKSSISGNTSYFFSIEDITAKIHKNSKKLSFITINLV